MIRIAYLKYNLHTMKDKLTSSSLVLTMYLTLYNRLADTNVHSLYSWLVIMFSDNPLVCIFSVLFIVVFLYYKWAFKYWSRKGVVYPTTVIPFGNAFGLLGCNVIFGEFFKQLYDTYKPQGLRYLGFYLFAKPTLVILDVNLIKTILTKDFHHFTDHGNYVNEEKAPLTGTLFALKGEKWKHLRAKLNPIFSSEKMKVIFHTLIECTDGLKDAMDEVAREEGPVDIKDLSVRFITDVIGTCAFGVDCNSLKDPNSKFRKLGRIIFDFSIFQSLVRFLSFTCPRILSVLGLKFLSKEASSFILNMVKETVCDREANNITRKDFMHMLIQLKSNHVQFEDNEDMEHFNNVEDFNLDDGITVEQIAAQALLFFLAGFETPSTALAFSLFEVVKNPVIQETLRNEIDFVLEKYNGAITYDSILEMVYMDKCVQETLRKYPPLPILFRECTQTYVIPGSNVTIEKGTRVFVPILGVHRDPEYYPNPNQFDPERFSAENKASRDPATWLAFGKGYRSCIGMRFGIMQVKVALAVLLRHYKFSLNSKTTTPISMSPETIALTAKGGIWLNVNKIERL